MSQPTGSFPQPQYAPPVPAKKSHTLRTVLIVVGVVAVLCCGGLVLGGYKLFTTVKEAIGPVNAAVDTFAGDLESGDTAGAYALLCGNTQAAFPLDAFQAGVAASPKITGHKITNTNVMSVNGRSTAVVTAQLTRSSGFPDNHTFTLVKESGAWKICGAPY